MSQHAVLRGGPSLLAAARSGDRPAALEVLRGGLAAAMQVCERAARCSRPLRHGRCT